MAWVAPILAGIGALGGLFGNRPQRTQQQQQQQQTGQQFQSGGSSTTPTLNPLAGTGFEHIANQYLNLIDKDPNLSGYQAQQTGQINQLADIQKRQAEENLAARGVTGPAASTATGNIESQRFGNIVGLNQQIPLLARQLQENTLGNAGQFFRSIPTGTYTGYYGGGTQQQTSIGTGSQQYPGNQLGGLFGGLGNILGLLAGMGLFPGQGGNGGPAATPGNYGGGT